MALKGIRSTALTCALLAGPFALANAADLTWDISATLVNGGGVSGSFVIDTSTGYDISEDITITSGAPSIPGATFDSVGSLVANSLGGSGGSIYASGTNSGGGGSDLVLYLSSSQWLASTAVGTDITISPGIGSCSASTGLCNNFGGSYYGNFEADVSDLQSGQLTLVNVSSVPEPTVTWLILSGLGILVVFARTRAAA